MEKAPITVLLSLYAKEHPDYLAVSLASIERQTLQPDEVLVVLDGPISPELDSVLANAQTRMPELHTLPQAVNHGLGPALAVGVRAARNQLIARMDTDDVMMPNRLQVQFDAFSSQPELDICGSNIVEFIDDPQKIVGKRTVPETNREIREFSKRRNPFNHMTVMFKRDAVLDAGNYRSVKSFEDYDLWARMLAKGARAKNIQEPLVAARTGRGMYARRGGLHYLWPGLKGRYLVYREGLGHVTDFLVASGAHIIVTLMPNSAREWIYTKKLHR